MPWYRTPSGQLLHAVGELADVHVARGAHQVADPVAEAEVESGAAQEAADAAAAAARAVDAAQREQEQKPAPQVAVPESDPQPKPKPEPPQVAVTWDTSVHADPLSPEDQQRVDDAIRDESPRHGLFGRKHR